MSLLAERTDNVEKLYQTAKEAIDKNLIETETRNEQIKEIKDRMNNLAISIDENVKRFTDITKDVLAEKGLDVYITSRVNKAIKSIAQGFADFNEKINDSYPHWEQQEKFIEKANEIIMENVSNFRSKELVDQNLALIFWYKNESSLSTLTYTNVGFNYKINDIINGRGWCEHFYSAHIFTSEALGCSN